MQLSSIRVGWAPPRTWFVTARLLEVAALVAVVGLAMQSWQVYQATGQGFRDSGQSLADTTPFLDRVTLFASYGFGFGQAPVAGTVACFLVLALLAILHFAQPVSHAALLRWEVLAVWAPTVLLNLAFVLSTAVALVRGDPNAPPDGVVSGSGPGPGFTTALLTGVTVPVLCLLLLSVSAIWWLRLPADFEAPEEGQDDGQHEGPVKSLRAARRWRPAPAQDANVDDLTLDGVELIEPVERLQPREGSSDGSTGSGYDDYFRRF
jgi:hypothetical protein